MKIMECEAPPDNDWFRIDFTLTFVKRPDYKKVVSKSLLHFTEVVFIY